MNNCPPNFNEYQDNTKFKEHQQFLGGVQNMNNGKKCVSYKDTKTQKSHKICDNNQYCKEYLNRETGEIDTLCTENKKGMTRKSLHRLKIGTLLFVIGFVVAVLGIWFVEGGNAYFNNNQSENNTYWGLKAFGYFLWFLAVVLVLISLGFIISSFV